MTAGGPGAEDERLVPVDAPEDVPPRYRDTPVDRLLCYHNLGAPFDAYERAALLVGMCMDHRKRLRMPDNFAYVIRTGGASLGGREFEISFALAVGGARAVALVGHSDCGMTGVAERREAFVEGLVRDAGWEPEAAEAHFREFVGDFAIGDALTHTLAQTERLRERYPGVLVAPLHYRVEDHRLYVVRP